MVLVTAVLGLARWWTGVPSLIGDLMAFSAMALGGALMMQSQREFRAAGLENTIEL